MKDLPYCDDFSALECAAIEAAPEVVPLCDVCGLAPKLDGTEECVACCVADVLHNDPDQLASWRRIFAGTAWLAGVEREVERQLSALVACGQAVAA